MMRQGNWIFQLAGLTMLGTEQDMYLNFHCFRTIADERSVETALSFHVQITKTLFLVQVLGTDKTNFHRKSD